jgi:hypothetical protein
MQEQLISFETAKLAKEKGFFDKNVYGEVRLSQQHYYDDRSILHNIREAFDEKDYDLKDCCNAPTQSLLQKWLREDKKISVEVTSGWWDKGKVEWEYNVYKKGLDGDAPCSLTVFKTYEEALEFGLQQGLKII